MALLSRPLLLSASTKSSATPFGIPSFFRIAGLFAAAAIVLACLFVLLGIQGLRTLPVDGVAMSSLVMTRLGRTVVIAKTGVYPVRVIAQGITDTDGYGLVVSQASDVDGDQNAVVKQ